MSDIWSQIRYMLCGTIFVVGLFIEFVSVVVCTFAVYVGYGTKKAKDYWNENH